MNTTIKKTISNNKGFTLTELSLAMAMLSVLLIIILLSILNITGVYNKGITLKRVNQSGRTIAAEMQTDLRKSIPNGGITKRVTTVGADKFLTGICTGQNSYIWNVYKDGVSVGTNITFDTGEPVSFVKVPDDGSLCKPLPPGPKKSISSVLLNDELVIGEPVCFGSAPDFCDPSSAAGGKMVRFEFTISTQNQGIGADSDITGGVCNGGGGNDFCALNTFVVTSYVNGVQ